MVAFTSPLPPVPMVASVVRIHIVKVFLGQGVALFLCLQPLIGLLHLLEGNFVACGRDIWVVLAGEAEVCLLQIALTPLLWRARCALCLFLK